MRKWNTWWAVLHRCSHGNQLGCIRLRASIKHGDYSGVNTPAGPGLCNMFSSQHPKDQTLCIPFKSSVYSEQPLLSSEHALVVTMRPDTVSFQNYKYQILNGQSRVYGLYTKGHLQLHQHFEIICCAFYSANVCFLLSYWQNYCSPRSAKAETLSPAAVTKGVCPG